MSKKMQSAEKLQPMSCYVDSKHPESNAATVNAIGSDIIAHLD